MATEEQIAALKYLVFASKDGNRLAKRLIAFALDHSEGLTKGVHVRLERNLQGYSLRKIKEAWRSLSAMRSSLGTTHLNELLQITGTDFRFHCSEHTTSCKLWLASRTDFVHADIAVTRAELEMIDLSKPGLYPGLEENRAVA